MDELEKKQISQELESILKSFGNVAPNYLKIRGNYKFHLGTGVYDILRKEICKCLIFGLNQASITLTNHLLEKFIKLTLIFKYTGFKYLADIDSDAQKFEEASKLYMDKNLDTTINIACSKGIINKAEKVQLHVYRESLRNAYSHADTSKLFGNVEIPIAFASLTELIL